MACPGNQRRFSSLVARAALLAVVLGAGLSGCAAHGWYELYVEHWDSLFGRGHAGDVALVQSHDAAVRYLEHFVINAASIARDFDFDSDVMVVAITSYPCPGELPLRGVRARGDAVELQFERDRGSLPAACPAVSGDPFLALHVVSVPRATVRGATTVVTSIDGEVQPTTQGGVDDSPFVLSVAPAFGPLTGGTEVVITGRYFQDVARLSFGGVDATNVRVDATATVITATSPPQRLGANELQLLDATGARVADASFVYAG